MPKLKSTPQQIREKKTMDAIFRARTEFGLTSDKSAADFLNISPACYCRYKKTSFQNLSLYEFSRIARLLKFSAEEVCTIIGVNFVQGNEESSKS